MNCVHTNNHVHKFSQRDFRAPDPVSSVFSVQVKMQKSLLCAWLRQKLCHCQNEKKSSDLSSNSSSFERTQSVRKVRKRLKRKYSQPAGGSSPSDTSSDTKRIHAYSVPNVSEIDSVCYDNVWISSGSLIVSFFFKLVETEKCAMISILKNSSIDRVWTFKSGEVTSLKNANHDVNFFFKSSPCLFN